MPYFPRQNIAMLCLILLAGGSFGCASTAGWDDSGLSYEPHEFRAALRSRVPQLSENEVVVPFDIPGKVKRMVRGRIRTADAGLNPVQILLSILTDPKPQGLGINYDWTVSATAEQALELGQGDCVSLAMLLVGLGRSIDWPIYFAEARPATPVAHQFGELTVLSSHMIVIVLTQQGPVMVDFLGLIDKSVYEIHPLDDLNAYAHLINNVTGHQIVGNAAVDHEAWEQAVESFQLVTRIEPTLGRGWNNLGIAYTRLGRFEEARSAYGKAMELDTVFGSPSRNLTIMETRASNAPSIVERAVIND